MAQRKRPETGPVHDSSASNEPSRINSTLQPHEWNAIVRYIKAADIGRVTSLCEALEDLLDSLGAKPNRKKYVKGLPEGSVHVDVQSFLVKLRRVTTSDAEAVSQLVALQATCARRIEG